MKSLVLSTTTALVLLSGVAAAQDAKVAAIYDNSHTVATNIKGITEFPTAPSSFDPIAASDSQLATYGLPPRPSPTADPDHYAMWAKAMASAKIKSKQPLTDTGRTSRAMEAAGGGRETAGTSAGALSTSSYNWSGIVNTVPNLKAWNSKTSVYYVVSMFNVPKAEQSFGSCDGGWDWEVSWNGIDGFNNGDVLQGGSESDAYCNGSTTSQYYQAWVEWYPSYSIIGEFAVSPGDDMYVETWDTSPTNGYVFVEDMTTLTYKTVNLTPTEGPYLVGNSAEYIVERPCCSSTGHYFTLANYVWNFWADSYAYNFINYDQGKATSLYAGSTATSTYLVSMLNDQGSVISFPGEVGPKYEFFMEDTGCAWSGGCTP